MNYGSLKSFVSKLVLFSTTTTTVRHSTGGRRRCLIKRHIQLLLLLLGRWRGQRWGRLSLWVAVLITVMVPQLIVRQAALGPLTINRFWLLRLAKVGTVGRLAAATGCIWLLL